MPVYPLRIIPLVKDGAYPHMMARDVEIWERWIDQYGGNFRHAAYDVALGGRPAQDPDADPAVLLGWRYSTAVKVDAVVIGDDMALAIEVKPNASLGAIGQALGAALLMEADNSIPLPIYPAVVTDRISPDAKYVASETGVLIFEVGEPLPPSDQWLRPAVPGARAGRELREGGALIAKDESGA